MNLSFPSFLGTEVESKPTEPTRVAEVSQLEPAASVVATESTAEDIITLEDHSNKDESISGGSSSPEITDRHMEESSEANEEEDDETMSLSELSASFQQCFQSINQNRKVVKTKKTKEPGGLLQLNPFDYEAARKEVKFGEDVEEESGSRVNSGGKKKSSAIGELQIDDGTKQFPQARRRQAFPVSGNRSSTFR